MFSKTSGLQNSEDSESSPYVHDSEEELEESISDCSVCWPLRLPYLNEILTTYGELGDSATDGCKLCELLVQISVEAFANA